MKTYIRTDDGTYAVEPAESPGWLLCTPMDGPTAGEPLGVIRGVERERHVHTLNTNGTLPDALTAERRARVRDAWLLELRAHIQRTAFPITPETLND